MKPLFLPLALAAPLALAGCGLGDLFAVDPTKAATDYIDSYNSLSSQYAAMPTPAFLPATGTASYTGAAQLTSASAVGAPYTGLVGKAELTADFDSGVVTGQLTDWVGATNIDPNNGAASNYAQIEAQARDATGALYVNVPVAAPSFDASISGTVSLDGVPYTVGGTAPGEFRGSAAEGVIVYGSTADALTISRGGSAQVGALAIAAEQ